MKITSDTRYYPIAPILQRLNESKVQEIREKSVRAMLGDGGYMGLTIADLQTIISGDVTKLAGTMNETELTVFGYYTADGFAAFFEDYTKKLQALTPVMTAEEKKAQTACMQVGMIEGLLYFVREYFGLHSFGEAEQATLADILLAKKDSYNKAVFSRAYNHIMSKKK